jgi:hypothetical protein
MRRVAHLIAAVAVLAAGLATPPSAAACVGCDVTFEALIRSSPSIVLAEYRGVSRSRAVFEVIDVLKGPRIQSIRLEPTVGLPGRRPWGRWLLFPSQGVMDVGFRVGTTGTVTNALTGEGQTNVYPGTLAGWYRALGLRLPDTSSAAGPPGPTAPGQSLPAPPLLAAAFLGAAAALRRRRPSGRGAGSGSRMRRLAALVAVLGPRRTDD